MRVQATIKYSSNPAGRIENGIFRTDSRFGKIVFFSKKTTLTVGMEYSGEWEIFEPQNSKVAFISPISVDLSDAEKDKKGQG